MMKLLGSAALIALPLAFVAWPAKAGPSAPQASQIVNEPVLVYDVSGSTIAGPFNQSLVVYNSGTAKLSQVSQLGGSSAAVTAVGSAEVLLLSNDLRAAGAWVLQDQDISTADLPLKTITVQRGFTNQQAHTYSYWLGSNAWAGPDSVVNEFIATHFPGF